MASASPVIGLSLRGHKKLVARLNRLKAGVQRRIILRAVSAALTPINRAAKAMAPTATKLLKKSIGKRVVRVGRGRSPVIWGGVGARMDPKYSGPGPKAWQVPWRYLHLVEFGTSHSAAKPFLRLAMDSQLRNAKAIMKRKVRQGIDREIARGGSK